MSSAAEEQVVIYDHLRNLYWRANERGYAASIHDAGLYTRAEGEEIVRDHAKSRKLTLRSKPSTTPDDVIVTIVREAMRDAWNDICADSGHRPRDLERRGNKTYFEPSTWAALTGEMVAARLRAHANSPTKARDD